MNLFEQNPELILSLAKLTSALLIAFAVAPLLKRPSLRATFWAAMFIILPTMIFVTHGRSIFNILPQLSTAPSIENVQPLISTVELVADPTPAVLYKLPSTTPQAPVQRTNWVAVVFFTGLIVSLLPILISILRICFLSKKPAHSAAMEAWAKIRPQELSPVPLYLTNSPSAPFTFGLIHEEVLLPESSTT